MGEHLAWYVSRSAGIVTWGLLVASMLWGFLYATRLLGRRARPWWMLGVHRFLGALAAVFVVVHVLAWWPTTTRRSASPTSSCRSRRSGAPSPSRSASSRS